MKKTHAFQFNTVLNSLIAAQGGLLFGYITGVIAAALIFLEVGYQLSTWQQAWLVSMTLWGAMLGVLANGQAALRLGRKITFILAGGFLAIGSVLCSIDFGLWCLYLGRFLAGFGVGMVSMIVPLYISEIAPYQIRGLLVLLNSVMITFGMLMAYVVGWLYAGLGDWQHMFSIGAWLSLMMVCTGLMMQESPRWCVQRGDLKRAKYVLSRLRSGSNIEAEFELMISNRHSSHMTVSPFKPPNRNVFIVGCMLAVIQQITGINAVLYFAPTIFQNAAFFVGHDAVLPTIFIGGINFLFTLVALFGIEHWGRRQLMLNGLGVMMCCLIGISLGYKVSFPSELMILFFSLFVGAFAWSAGCLFWVLIAEIFPLKMRGQAMGVVIMMNWGANLLVTLSFLPLMSSIGSTWIFLIYAFNCLFSLIFCYYFIPETKNVSLEVIEQNLVQGKPIRHIGMTLEK